MNSCSAVPGVNGRNEQWTADGTQRVSFHCSARGQGGCANNQPVTHAADTQQHVDHITMVSIVLLKTKKFPIL
jgi:hypothetical protein